MTTNYLSDSNSPTGYPQVVEEIQGGSVIKSFAYGHSLISQQIVGGSLSFYQYDGHGSVRLLTNASGAITDTYDYDAFGNLIASTGATPNERLFAGEQFDADLGLYYLRARYMNPASGRFLTQDSYEGVIQDPFSLHKYLFANADAVNNTDPSGAFSIVDVAITLSVFTVVLTLSSCSANVPIPRPVNFNWVVNQSQWVEAGKEIPTVFSESDKDTIKVVMYQSFREAYKPYAVTPIEGASKYNVNVAFSFSSNGCDRETPGSTLLVSDVYLCAACYNARAQGRERNAKISTSEIVAGVGTGMGRSAAHEFYHQLTASMASQRHTTDPTDIMWGTNPGESGELIPWDLYYGHQEFKEARKAVLNRLVSREN